MALTYRLRIQRLLDDLEEAAQKLGLNKADIAACTGLHKNTLAGFCNRHGKPGRRPWNPTLTTIALLERLLIPPTPTRRAEPPGG